MTKGTLHEKKPVRQHGKSTATWKKHRNMEKAPQHEKKKTPQRRHQYPVGGARKSNWYDYMMAAALR